MSSKTIFKRPIQKGQPLASSGVAEGLQSIARALDNLEVVGRNGIKAKLEWSNGIPRITIEMEKPNV